MNYHLITRRESIKKILKISGGLALTSSKNNFGLGRIK